MEERREARFDNFQHVGPGIPFSGRQKELSWKSGQQIVNGNMKKIQIAFYLTEHLGQFECFLVHVRLKTKKNVLDQGHLQRQMENF